MNQSNTPEIDGISTGEALLMALRIFKVAEILSRYMPEFSTDRDEIHLQNHETQEIRYREAEDL
jgi:hypothetical protein